MSTNDDPRLDVSGLLEAVEAAAPIDAVDVLASELRDVVDARHVSLLITNLSGDADVRLSHVTIEEDQQDGRNERVESLPLAGSMYQQVLFSQELSVSEEPGGLARAGAGHRAGRRPRPARALPTGPPQTRDGRVPLVGSPCPGIRPHRIPAPHRPLRVVPARHPLLPRRRGTTPAPAGRLHAGGRLHREIGDIPPAELEAAWYRHHPASETLVPT